MLAAHGVLDLAEPRSHPRRSLDLLAPTWLDDA